MATFVLSNSHKRNSHGFSIDLAGMDTERFGKNPVMLWNHDRDRVIGRWVNLRIEDGKLTADADFDSEDPFAAEIERKVERGYLKGCSVGIYISRWDEPSQSAAETELIEASIVAIPSDADAVALYDRDEQPTTLEAVKLSFNQNSINMDKEQFELTAATLQSLSIEGEPTAEAVETAVAAKDARIAELEAVVARNEQERIAALVDKAVAEKKIGADERDTYMQLAAKDFAGVERILARMKGVEPIAGELQAKGTAGKYEGKTWDELDRAGLLASLKAEAPEKFDELYRQKFNV